MTATMQLAVTEARQIARRPSRAKAVWHKAWPPLLVVVFVTLAWELAIPLLGISTFIIAAPSAIAAEMVIAAPLLLQATWVTTLEIFWGFLISVIVGVAIALLVVRYKWVERAIYPLIILFQTVPKVALAPIFILWFGYTMTPKLVLIVVIAFFPITINMVLGLKRTDDDLILLMRSVGSSRTQILTKVQLPNSLPYLFAGTRIAITLAVIGAVVAEFAGSQDGLGHMIQFASTQLDTAQMFAALIVVSLLGLAFYYAVGLVELLMRRRFPHIATDAV
ncbi:ABC transporter permease [Agrococcus beijingensis]|uniref:ABC transporter permease n=1 Tax=Agrococcus beijingensis TaxID=3068634 RepID=UPI002740A733|nr:ABC transporter permease [Agrococcus sp. REN33]